MAILVVALATSMVAGCIGDGSDGDGISTTAIAPAALDIQGLPAVFDVVSRSGGLVSVAGAAWVPDGATTVVLAVHGCCGMNVQNNFQPLDAAPGYSLGAAIAASGRAFVAIDLPGTGSSPSMLPTGGAIDDEALLAHQVAGALRSGDYAVDGADARAFDRVVALGHSRGSIIIEIAQGYFGSFDAIVPTGWASGGFSEEAEQCFNAGDCPEDRDPRHGLGPSMMFHLENADPGVVEELMGGISGVARTQADLALVLWNDVVQSLIRVPVLNIEGAEDWVFDRETMEAEPARFPNAPRSDLLMLENTGHMVFHHLTKDDAAGGLVAWLDDVGV